MSAPSHIRCTTCYGPTYNIGFEIVCTNCGTVHSADYLSYDVDYTTNEELSAPHTKQVTVNAAELDKVAELLGLSEAVTATALELFTDVVETIKCKGLHRQMLMNAALYVAQRITGSTSCTRSKADFGKLNTGPVQAHFARACNEMDEYINDNKSRKWDVLKVRTQLPITRFFVESVGKIMQDMEIPGDDRARVRQMGSAICEKVQGHVLLDGIKDANIAIAIVFAASKICKVDGVSLVNVGASEQTVKKVVRLVHEIIVGLPSHTK